MFINVEYIPWNLQCRVPSPEYLPLGLFASFLIWQYAFIPTIFAILRSKVHLLSTWKLLANKHDTDLKVNSILKKNYINHLDTCHLLQIRGTCWIILLHIHIIRVIVLWWYSIDYYFRGNIISYWESLFRKENSGKRKLEPKFNSDGKVSIQQKWMWSYVCYAVDSHAKLQPKLQLWGLNICEIITIVPSEPRGVPTYILLGSSDPG